MRIRKSNVQPVEQRVFASTVVIIIIIIIITIISVVSLFCVLLINVSTKLAQEIVQSAFVGKRGW